jgi:adenosine deaminase
VYPDFRTRPLRALYEAGVLVTINSHDPPLFNTTLSQEVLPLHEPFGLDVVTIDEILLTGYLSSFLEREREQHLEATFRVEFARLKPETITAL